MQGGRRFYFIDELRGAAVLCMVFYHAFYTAGIVFDWRAGRELLYFFMPAEPAFAALFIFISGFCTRFSHSVARRGALLAAVAVGITAVTVAAGFFGLDIAIYFGVVHLIAASMLLFAALRRALGRVPPAAGFAAALILFIVTFDVRYGRLGVGGLLSLPLPAALYGGGVWSVFGFCDEGFFSADYFPLLPWVFMFFAGAFFGRLVKDPLPDFLAKKRLPPLAFLGRYSLWVYLIHQPAIFAVCWLISLL